MSGDITKLRLVSQTLNNITSMADELKGLLDVKEAFESFPELLFSAKITEITEDKQIIVEIKKFPGIRQVYDEKDYKDGKITISLFMSEKTLIKSITGCSDEAMQTVLQHIRALRFALQYMSKQTAWIERCLYMLGNSYLRALAEDRASLDKTYRSVLKQATIWIKTQNKLIEYFSSGLAIQEQARLADEQVNLTSETENEG